MAVRVAPGPDRYLDACVGAPRAWTFVRCPGTVQPPRPCCPAVRRRLHQARPLLVVVALYALWAGAMSHLSGHGGHGARTAQPPARPVPVHVPGRSRSLLVRVRRGGPPPAPGPPPAGGPPGGGAPPRRGAAPPRAARRGP